MSKSGDSRRGQGVQRTRTPKTADTLRSHRWWGPQDLRSFGHRSRLKQMGYSADDYLGRPAIGIFNTWDDLTHCHAHFKQRVEDIKRGILQAGGFPLEIPAMALSESFLKPTSMLYRNFLSMQVEEWERANPIDGVVLMGGCDKTTPALLMGAISAGLPAIYFPAGPMLRGNWHGKVLGSGSDAWKYWDEKRAGLITIEDWEEIENGIARSSGVCMTMGTAATMTSLAEVIGMSLPGASSIPAADANHQRMAAECGRRVVQMVWEDLRPADVLTPEAFHNAIVALAAMGGSTNAYIHLIAIARRAGIDLKLARFDELSRGIPVVANIRPSGAYLMEDFYYAGGIRALLREISSKLDLTQLTVNGKTLGENIAGTPVWNRDVIRPLDNPISRGEGLAVLTGNLAPDGCVMKPSACDPRFLKHSGPALVFSSYNQMAANIDREDLDVTPDHVLVLQNAGPQGGPGMPEWGMLPIPKKLVRQGVRDMLRLSDARMSGTSYGACVLHIAPEAFIGGPFAAVRTGDRIAIDVRKRSLHLDISDVELRNRLASRPQPPPRIPRGYGLMFLQHVKQANEGCDFDFLEGQTPIPEPEIH
ncbi:MAG TPA: L-arabinonate dehydratase [Candidatus Sulfotelmatobacter sp.]|nr:L-arabinonate dehydratase [Candidatus Sulfotelmatobacter sp.]